MVTSPSSICEILYVVNSKSLIFIITVQWRLVQIVVPVIPVISLMVWYQFPDPREPCDIRFTDVLTMCATCENYVLGNRPKWCLFIQCCNILPENIKH